MDPQNQPRIIPADRAGIAEAARLILEGKPVAVPTETVYGLAADATNAQAVARIFAAKGRPLFNPLIVHVAAIAEAEAIGDFSKGARGLAEAFWPGPLTLVVPLRKDTDIASAVTAGLATIALRCPSHPVMRAVLRACGRPLAAPSANASGRISATRADHVAASLGGRIALILDGGPTECGLESTIVGLDGQGIRLLRPGPIALASLLAAVGGREQSAGTAIEAPGQLCSHYAPSKPLRLDAERGEAGEWLIGFGIVQGNDNLSPAGNLDEAASRLFDALHRAEASARPRIAVAPIPRHGLGQAINDRLARAAAPRGG